MPVASQKQEKEFQRVTICANRMGARSTYVQEVIMEEALGQAQE
jgi:hypothetical protein